MANAQLLQLLQQDTGLGVGISDLAVVEVVGIFGAIRLRREVRRVRVEVVDPHEELFVPVLAKPLARRLVGQLGRPLAEHVGRIPYPLGQIVVVILEPLIQAEPGIQYEGGDNRARAIPSYLQHLCQCRDLVLQTKGSVGSCPMSMGVQTGQQRRVAGQRGGAGGNRLRTQDALPCQLVDDRRLDAAVPVTADVVRSGGVRGDDQHVEIAQRPRRGLDSIHRLEFGHDLSGDPVPHECTTKAFQSVRPYAGDNQGRRKQDPQPLRPFRALLRRAGGTVS